MPRNPCRVVEHLNRCWPGRGAGQGPVLAFKGGLSGFIVSLGAACFSPFGLSQQGPRHAIPFSACSPAPRVPTTPGGSNLTEEKRARLRPFSCRPRVDARGTSGIPTMGPIKVSSQGYHRAPCLQLCVGEPCTSYSVHTLLTSLSHSLLLAPLVNRAMSLLNPLRPGLHAADSPGQELAWRYLTYISSSPSDLSARR